MPHDVGFLGFVSSSLIIKLFLLLFLIFYSIFSLIIFRQIQLMAKSLPISLSPALKFVAIIQIGISLALLFIAIGVF